MKVSAVLPGPLLDWRLLGSAAAILAAAIYGLRWRKRWVILKRMEEEKRRREESERRMRRAVEEYHKKNPGVDGGKILALTIPELSEKMADGTLTPESVLYTYIEKALQVNADLNCVTVFLTDCESQLKDLSGVRVRGPLFGVPVSIKEHVGYQGHPSTCGLVQYLDVLEEEDSVIVKVLKKQGAIVFAKTNLPQSVLCCETSNPIYGYTLNPHNKAKGPSGSSGGEGALIGGGGSILGIGTDIGGSIRLPASSCGIAGFKPTPTRVSIHGVRPCLDGMTAVPICVGPMARDVDSLVLTMKALWCDEHFHLDPNVPPLYFNEKAFSSVAPLRIGYYEEDGFFQPNPSMRRILLETKKLLEAAGHELVPFSPPRVDSVYNLFVKTLFGDGGKPLEHKFDNNLVDPYLRENLGLCRMSGAVKRLIGFCLRPIFPRISKAFYSSVGARSLTDSWADQTALQDYQTEFIREWRILGLDVVLCPMLGPAFNKGHASRLLATISYTMIYNVLQFPAGVVPVGSVTRDDEEELRNYRGYENDPWDRLFREAVSGGVGLPLSVQCVALPYQDELCLRLMKEVETLSHHRR